MPACQNLVNGLASSRNSESECPEGRVGSNPAAGAYFQELDGVGVQIPVPASFLKSKPLYSYNIIILKINRLMLK